MGQSQKVIAFIKEVIEVSKKHGLSISHEDLQGGFIVSDKNNEENYAWLLEARDNVSK